MHTWGNIHHDHVPHFGQSSWTSHEEFMGKSNNGFWSSWLGGAAFMDGSERGCKFSNDHRNGFLWVNSNGCGYRPLHCSSLLTYTGQIKQNMHSTVQWIMFTFYDCLQDAMSLDRRPPFHNSSVIILIISLLFMLAQTMPKYQQSVVQNSAWIFSIAWTSHHIRDGSRRGLWFWPIGNTPPLGKWLYIISVMILPMVFRLIGVSMVDINTKKIKLSSHAVLDV